MTNQRRSDVDGTCKDFTSSDGQLIVSTAREAISYYLQTRKQFVSTMLLSDKRFIKKLGCFTTIKSNDDGKALRGCIGFPEPVYALSKALPESAIAAATRDPRFPSVSPNELNSILLEINILTAPKIIEARSPVDIPKKVSVGNDGLILRWSFGLGLLLPQVAKEYGWDAEDFLCNVAMKAGAPPDQWLVPGTIISKFQSQIFEEESPNGPVHLVKD